LKSLFDANPAKKRIIITDNTHDISLLQDFAKIFLGQKVHTILSLTDFWMMHESESGIFCISHSLLEIHGDSQYLKRHSLYELRRNTENTIETTIDKLIEFGYTHANHLGELATYRRE
jgi:hypothetical protein